MHAVVKDHLATQNNLLLTDTSSIEQMFVDAEQTQNLKTRLVEKNANIAGYFNETDFQESWATCIENPQTFNVLIQTDPRYMEILKEEVADIDLMAMVEEKWRKEEESK